MTSWLNKQSFSTYPPQGREVANANFAALQEIPVALLPVFLVDLNTYDWKFPAEQQEILKRIKFVGANPPSVAGFSEIRVPSNLNSSKKTSDPQRYLSEMTAYLWSSLQMDAYRAAADQFVRLLDTAVEPLHPPLPRLVMVCVGRDAQEPAYPLFQKLRAFGQFHTSVHTDNAAEALLNILDKRTEAHWGLYDHWYVDGGSPFLGKPAKGATQIFYPDLAPLNTQILARIKACIESGTGPEVLQKNLAELSHQSLLGNKDYAEERLQHFAISILAEGSGTQIFSTSFVQWTAREILRRAQPVTLLVRFAPRQHHKSFNAMIVAADTGAADLDPEGSLIDADMSAYYAYLELMRLPDSENSGFLVWFENHSQALVAGRGVAAGSVSKSPTSIAELLAELKFE